MLCGRDGSTKYELGEEIKSGGEGVVYTIVGRPNSVAKVYKHERVADPRIREATKDKIFAMLDMHFDPHFNGRVIVAWPEDALFDNAGFFRGFVMPKIENMKSLIWATRPSDRDALWPNGYHWSYSIAIAFNLALTIEHLHKAGIVVGDMNTNNVLIDSKGNVTLIDADSFNITTRTGKTFKCIVGFPEVLPPELQGKDLIKETSKFTEKTDCFALAVHIFNLLCNNCHPFGCLSYNTAHGSSSNPEIMDNIIKGYCPYVSGETAKTVEDALDMGVFPIELRDLFYRAFHYDATTAVKKVTIESRPSAQEWRVAIGNLYKAGVSTCNKNTLHEYPRSYHGGCPWCAIEQRKNPSRQPQSHKPQPSKPKYISIPIVHCDKDGNTLRSHAIDIEYGKSGSVYAEQIPGYHIISSRNKIEVTVDKYGKPSKTPIRFTYEKDKKQSGAGKKFLVVVFIIGLLYCLVMYGLIRSATNEGNYEQAKQYMDIFPLYKELFSEDYDNTVREIQINERVWQNNYSQAVSDYRNGYYYDAYSLFETIDTSYRQTSIYLEFCQAHMNWLPDYFSTIYNNISFEDAKELLMWNDQMFCRYMVGTWTTTTTYGSQIVTMTDNGGGSFTVNGVPELPDGGTFSISNGIWQYQYADTVDWIDYFQISIISKTRFTLYSYQTGTTYTFTKD